jgi:hypothetical protein
MTRAVLISLSIYATEAPADGQQRRISEQGSRGDQKVLQSMEAITQAGVGGAYHVRFSFRQTDVHDVVNF